MHKCKHKDMKTDRLLLLLPDSYPVAISESGGGGREDWILLRRAGCHGKGRRKDSDWQISYGRGV